MNLQSLQKKEAIISTTDPTFIIIGTDTLLNDQTASSEFISNRLQYDIYLRDITTDSHGGVLLATKSELTLSNIHKSDAIEFINGIIKLKNQEPAVIAAYYRSI